MTRITKDAAVELGLKLITIARNQPNGESTEAEIGNAFGLSQSTISRILHQKEGSERYEYQN